MNEKIKVKSVFTDMSECNVAEKMTFLSLEKADSYIMQQIAIKDCGFAKVRATVIFEDGETLQLHGDFGNWDETFSGSVRYHDKLYGGEMPSWYFGSLRETWAERVEGWAELREKYDLGVE